MQTGGKHLARGTQSGAWQWTTWGQSSAKLCWAIPGDPSLRVTASRLSVVLYIAFSLVESQVQMVGPKWLVQISCCLHRHFWEEKVTFLPIGFRHGWFLPSTKWLRRPASLSTQAGFQDAEKMTLKQVKRDDSQELGRRACREGRI